MLLPRRSNSESEKQALLYGGHGLVDLARIRYCGATHVSIHAGNEEDRNKSE